MRRPDLASSPRLSRRRFLGTAAAAAVGAALPLGASAAPAIHRVRRKPRIGAISYSFRQLPGSAEETLGYLVTLGLDTVELMGYTAEGFAGAPAAPPWPGRDATEAERAAFREAREAYAAEARAWRLAAPMDRFEALRRLYEGEGVAIDILKLGEPGWTDEEIDYAFRAARAVGARGISFEISDEAAARMGPFATEHALITGMHNHTQIAEEGFSWDRPLAHSPYHRLNLDIGHYVAGLDASPIPMIEQYHDRISHLHLKDRKKGSAGGENVVWGEGDTPIGEVLRTIRDAGYPIPGMIELEYPIPEGSDVMTEMARCAEFCRDALS